MTGGALLVASAPALAQPSSPVTLGAAETFVVLGGTSVATAPAAATSTLNGDLGVSPGTVLPPVGSVTLGTGATRHLDDAVAAQAASDLDEVFSDLQDRACPAGNTLVTNPPGVYAGGTLPAPGVYCFDQDNVQVTGNVSLTGPGQYIVKIAGTLTTGRSRRSR